MQQYHNRPHAATIHRKMASFGAPNASAGLSSSPAVARNKSSITDAL